MEDKEIQELIEQALSGADVKPLPKYLEQYQEQFIDFATEYNLEPSETHLVPAQHLYHHYRMWAIKRFGSDCFKKKIAVAYIKFFCTIVAKYFVPYNGWKRRSYRIAENKKLFVSKKLNKELLKMFGTKIRKAGRPCKRKRKRRAVVRKDQDSSNTTTQNLDKNTSTTTI